MTKQDVVLRYHIDLHRLISVFASSAKFVVFELPLYTKAAPRNEAQMVSGVASCGVMRDADGLVVYMPCSGVADAM